MELKVLRVRILDEEGKTRSEDKVLRIRIQDSRSQDRKRKVGKDVYKLFTKND